ncbi:NAD-dependent epimerase/dehydratase family protein [Flavobacterium sp. P21]|uniref:NAD-dependent epimerase/dehydratase family protein n=1 Tax=Flavobacterium sp. P21 TaxID=3423948 RepID=UPI003D67F45D
MVLLTGCSGFLGKTIMETLRKDFEIIGLSRNSGQYQICLENKVPVFSHFFDLVIHNAGKAHSIPKTEFQKKQFYDVNFEGTLNLLKGLEKSNLPKYFVFISSVSVYGQEAGNNINEEHPLMAKDPYGLSKIDAENLILKWCEKNNVVATILRLPLLVGKNPPGNLGAMVRAINKGYYFNIANGKARKSMVLSKDVASIIPTVFSIGGIYNLTDGFHPSFDELSTAISKNTQTYFNIPLFIAKIFGRIGDILGDKAPINSLKVSKITSDLTFDDSKARRLLKWKPELVLDYLKKEQI